MARPTIIERLWNALPKIFAKYLLLQSMRWFWVRTRRETGIQIGRSTRRNVGNSPDAQDDALFVAYETLDMVHMMSFWRDVYGEFSHSQELAALSVPHMLYVEFWQGPLNFRPKPSVVWGESEHFSYENNRKTKWRLERTESGLSRWSSCVCLARSKGRCGILTKKKGG